MADEDKKKSLTEQLEDVDFKSIGGLNIFDTPVSVSDTLKRIEEGREKEKVKQATEEAIDLYPKGSKGFAEATKDKTILENAEENNEVSLGESVSNAIISGAIKIPYGWAQLTAEIKDAIGDDVPLEETNLAKLDAWFDSTVMGELMNYSEEKARATGSGRVVEFLTSIYGNYKLAGKPIMKAIQDPGSIKRTADNIVDKVISAKKNGRYISSNSKNLKKTADKVKELNFGKRVKNWTGIAVGGGVTGGLVADNEDIGTWGDWLFEPGHYSSLDRTKKVNSSDDAIRMLKNRLKFGGEMAFPIAPIFFGVGKFGKFASKYGGDAAFSNKAVERWADKYIMKPFRARSDRPRPIFKVYKD